MAKPKVETVITVFPVKDLNRSVQFYADTLGFHVDWRRPVIASVSRDGRPIMLFQNIPSDAPSWVFIGLSDYALFDHYRSMGVKVLQEPENHEWGYEMKFEDIDGNVLWLATETRDDIPLDDG